MLSVTTFPYAVNDVQNLSADFSWEIPLDLDQSLQHGTCILVYPLDLLRSQRIGVTRVRLLPLVDPECLGLGSDYRAVVYGVYLHELALVRHFDMLLSCDGDLPWEIRDGFIVSGRLDVVVQPNKPAHVDLQLLATDAKLQRVQVRTILAGDEEESLSCQSYELEKLGGHRCVHD